MKEILLLLIKLYRRCLSPLKMPSCRFYPTCSGYALEAITAHGALRGGFLCAKRILKCHPFHPGGVDYPPPADRGKTLETLPPNPCSEN